jgi:hypothetical protein
LQHQIQQQVQRRLARLRWHQHVVVDIVEAGGGVAVAPKGLHSVIELTGRQLLAALEHHVLEEVGDARFLQGFARTAGAAPEIDADHGSLRQIDLHQGGPVAQLLLLRLR